MVISEKKNNLGYVKVPRNNATTWLPLLKQLYQFESGKISGPGSQKRDINDSIWTLEEFYQSVALDENQKESFLSMVDWLVDERQIMRIPGDEEDSEKYISRVGEIVRILGHGYEYWHRGRPGVNATRWLIEDKKIPERVVSSTEFRDVILKKVTEISPGNKGFNLKTATKEVCEAVARKIADEFGGDWENDVKFSEFQLNCTVKILESKYDVKNPFRAQVLTAGVGSGKTIGFTIATLIEARKSILDGISNDDWKTTSIFIYPRTQLAIDQHEEISKIASYMTDSNGNSVSPEVWLEHYRNRFYTEGAVTTGVVEKYGTHSKPIPIIITTYETLKRRMVRPEFIRKLSKHLSTIVLDEIHLSSGVSGGMSSYLLSRLSATTKKEVFWIGASATIARPDEHASKLFGLNKEEVGVIEPKLEELKQAGINHHIFLKPNPGMSILGSLVNATSRLIHNRRHNLSERIDEEGNLIEISKIEISNRQKSIGFADNLEMLGRWNDDLRENERTSKYSKRQITNLGKKHPNKQKIEDWHAKNREIPYALRFHKPLQRRLTNKGGNDEDHPGDKLSDLTNLFEKEKIETICDNCMAGNRVVLGEIEPNNLLELSKLVHRYPHKEDDAFKAFKIKSDCFIETEKKLIGSHELCPMLQSGACSWFPKSEIDKIFKIPKLENSNQQQYYTYSSAIKSTVFSGKSDKSNNLDDIIFEESVKHIFDEGPKPGSEKDITLHVDMVLASPSLEVGVDIPMLTESVMTKAIRNIASYRQKAGRVGRETNLDTMNVTIMSQNSVDMHYYRQPRKLVSEGRLEPVPLMDNNLAILACSAYGSVWEWLALNSELPEWIGTDHLENKTNKLSSNLKECIDCIEKRRNELVAHIHVATKNRLRLVEGGGKIVNDAINQVVKEIDLLLEPIKSTYKVTKLNNNDLRIIDLFAIGRRAEGDYPRGVSVEKIIEVDDRLLDDYGVFKDDIITIIEKIEPTKYFEEYIEIYHLLTEISSYVKIGALKSENIQNYKDNLEKRLNEIELEYYDEMNFDDLVNRLKKIIHFLNVFEEKGYKANIVKLYDDFLNIRKKGAEGENDSGAKQAYLSDVLSNLPSIEFSRKDTWFLKPETLFENPYTKSVDLYVENIDPERPDKIQLSQKQIPLNEALFSLIPGTWTHRIPHRKLKTRTGILKIGPDNTLIATMKELNRVGNRFRVVKSETLPAPPGAKNGVRVWAPSKLVLIEAYDKYLTLDKKTTRITDYDEQEGKSKNYDEIGGDDWEGKRVRIPKTFNNRWIWSEPGKGEEISAFRLSNTKFSIEDQNDEEIYLKHSEGIKHPINSSLLDGIFWHEKIEVIEYTFSNSRSYGADGQIELVYKDEHDRTVSFGERYETEAFSLTLNKEVIDNVSNILNNKMIEGDGGTTPSLLNAFKAYISIDKIHGGAEINPYSIDDFISIILINSNWQGRSISISNWIKMIKEAGNENDKLKGNAKKYYNLKLRLERKKSDEEIENQNIEKDDAIAEKRAVEIIQILKTIILSVDNFPNSINLWIHRTILSSLGITAVSALQQFSGCESENIGYLIEPDSWEGKNYRVTVYDRANFGNGSCRVVKEYMHIPDICRQFGKNSKLPTTDYLSTLEEGLLQCMQHQSDLGALTIQEIGDESALEAIPDLVGHSKETFEISKTVWNQVNIQGTKDAWTLPIHKRLATFYEKEKENIFLDDIDRAFTSCWDGCPECIEDIRITLGGHRGLNFIDKYILDYWFLDGIKKSEDYGIHKFRGISNGSENLHLGSLTKLHLTAPNKDKIRSICLPWTMGFMTSRQGSINPKLVIRNTDVSNLRIGGMHGSADGIESHGFRRLLWFDLLMTGHLDSVGAIPEEKKKIQLLYFDARDIFFKDLGLSHRMLDSMMAVDSYENIEKLSDVIRWMLRRGFEVEICIDRYRALEIKVNDFLNALGEHEKLSIKSLTPELSTKKNMHKKILITPIAALHGSANLTYSGTETGDENISHVLIADNTQYKSVQASARTTLAKCELLSLGQTKKYRNFLQGNNYRKELPLEKKRNEFEDIVWQIHVQKRDEDEKLEFKEKYSAQFKPVFNKHTGLKEPILHDKLKKEFKKQDIIDLTMKEINGMLNTEGGYVVCGVRDSKNTNDGKPEIVGIKEINSLNNFENYHNNVRIDLRNRLGVAGASHVKSKIVNDEEISGGKSVLVFIVKPNKILPAPFLAKGDLEIEIGRDREQFFIREAESTVELKGYLEIEGWSKTRFSKEN